MTELLAIPGWQTSQTTLDAWVTRLEERSGGPVTVERDAPDGAWVVIGRLRLRGYAILAGPNVEAINFEVAALDSAQMTQFLEETAASLAWEIYPDDGDNDDSDEDDD
jgi:hypothetical protein